MKRLMTALAVAAGAGAVFAAPAHADSADAALFVAVLHSQGWSAARGGDYTLIRNGYEVCGQFARGRTGGEIARQVYLDTGLDVSRSDAIEFVVTAVRYLCPQFAPTPQSTTSGSVA